MGPELQVLSDDLLRFYADCFCKGSISSARAQLDLQQNEMRRKDLLLISFFAGATLTLMTILLFLIIIPAQDVPGDDTDHFDELTSGVEVYWFALLICFIIAATGFAV